jgi:predicted kinase
MHNIEAGDKVTFETTDGKTASGTVSSAGKDGVTVNGQSVRWKDIRGFTPKDGAKKPDYNKKGFIEPQKFNAYDWARQFVDPKATPNDAGVDYILDSFKNSSAEELKKKIEWAIGANKQVTPTKDWYCVNKKEGKDAEYTSDREALHGRIMNKLLSPDKMRTAKPRSGEKPTMIMLGGRGGSGKSWFKNNVYDPDKFVILDADSIKEELPEYKGWNAYQLHDESSDILEQMIDLCKNNGLNVVIDMTMKTPKSAYERLALFKDKGYRTEAHYMHLPPQEAAKRAINRYRNGDKENDYKGRFVPPGNILAMTKNEETFDLIKGLVDDWSFRDSTDGFPPGLISTKGKGGLHKKEK